MESYIKLMDWKTKYSENNNFSQTILESIEAQSKFKQDFFGIHQQADSNIDMLSILLVLST